MSEPAATVEVYQLKIVLTGVSPMVWRRVLVRSDTTIAQLHVSTTATHVADTDLA